MRPGLTEANVPANVSAFVRSEKRFIRQEVDLKFRKALLEFVAQDGPPTARFHIRNALDQGPSRGGVQETISYFGDELDVKLKLTAQIVDGLEISVPGFKKWLELTGFGNDKAMIRGFVAWAEHKAGKGRVITGVKEVAEEQRS